MNIEATALPGVFILQQKAMADVRGMFAKVFNAELYLKNKLRTDFRESYYSESKANVVRGMHFQTPPYENDKIVYVLTGAITDVVLDMRKSSPSFGRHCFVELSRENRKCIYIPAGCAHGFLVTGESATVVYMQTSVYSPQHDAGILWDSFGMHWGIKDPVLSERDRTFPLFKDFKSPF